MSAGAPPSDVCASAGGHERPRWSTTVSSRSPCAISCASGCTPSSHREPAAAARGGARRSARRCAGERTARRGALVQAALVHLAAHGLDSLRPIRSRFATPPRAPSSTARWRPSPPAMSTAGGAAAADLQQRNRAAAQRSLKNSRRGPFACAEEERWLSSSIYCACSPVVGAWHCWYGLTCTTAPDLLWSSASFAGLALNNAAAFIDSRCCRRPSTLDAARDSRARVREHPGVRSGVGRALSRRNRPCCISSGELSPR